MISSTLDANCGLQSDDFALLKLSRCLTQNDGEMEKNWRALQRQFHPDKFVHEDAATRRLALQCSARLNEAYARLKNPVARASYLCGLWGEPVGQSTREQLTGEFLMQQLVWREMLEESSEVAELTALQSEIAQNKAKLLTECAAILDNIQPDNLDSAAIKKAVRLVMQLMFLDKILNEINTKLA